jgi:hypothetical protein
MPRENPLINGSAAGATPPAATPADAYPGGSVLRNTGIQSPFTGEHNTAAQVAVLVLLAAGVLGLLQTGGFRFVVDAGIGRR